MGATLTIRNLDETVKYKLRMRAASHQRSMEAEARAILTQAVDAPNSEDKKNERIKQLMAVTGKWKGRGSTDQLMRLTRGED